MRFVHIVNTLQPPAGSDLETAQPVTLASMLRAREYARQFCPDLEICQVSACFSTDQAHTPENFDGQVLLEQSSADFGPFLLPRQLPLIGEIMRGAKDFLPADFLIYTNIDIALQPFFYEYVAEQTGPGGRDALIINRRTIGNKKSDQSGLASLYAELGEDHPGFDCFVMPARYFADFKWGNVFIGANWVGRILLANTFGFAQNPRLIKRAQLTFHLGDDQAWRNHRRMDYDRHNAREVLAALKELKATPRFHYSRQIKDYAHELRNLWYMPPGRQERPDHPIPEIKKSDGDGVDGRPRLLWGLGGAGQNSLTTRIGLGDRILPAFFFSFPAAGSSPPESVPREFFQDLVNRFAGETDLNLSGWYRQYVSIEAEIDFADFLKMALDMILSYHQHWPADQPGERPVEESPVVIFFPDWWPGLEQKIPGELLHGSRFLCENPFGYLARTRPAPNQNLFARLGVWKRFLRDAYRLTTDNEQSELIRPSGGFRFFRPVPEREKERSLSPLQSWRVFRFVGRSWLTYLGARKMKLPF